MKHPVALQWDSTIILYLVQNFFAYHRKVQYEGLNIRIKTAISVSE